MTVARTAAVGEGLSPDILAFETSLPIDRRLYRVDIAGSLAHVVMLGRTGIIPAADAERIREGLLGILEDADRGLHAFEGEEDIHMAVEAELLRRIGEPAQRLHTARSRNDQVALDTRLYVRERAAAHLASLADLIDTLRARAASPEGACLMPGYTHRQRAQPIRAAYLYAAWAVMLGRDLDAFLFVLDQVDALPLGVGALSGSSLPIDREGVRALLGFSRLTTNGLDTVGDRDFALDFSYACARSMIHLSRIAADVVDFATEEFGFFALDGSIACGSSMMPQKKNPDVFELLRGKSSGAVGDLFALLTLVKGLPVGYMRDLQEDKAAVFATDDRLGQCLAALKTGLAGLTLRPERAREGTLPGFTQATDLAERLVSAGAPFRRAYRAVGALVRKCIEERRPLASLTLAEAQTLAPEFTEGDLRLLDPERAVDAKESAGGTGPQSLERQLAYLSACAVAGRSASHYVPTAESLIRELSFAPLSTAAR
jgi:argininosuccinate lyase